MSTAIQPGTIFASSWGYDQTNVNFYRVVRSTPKTVVLQEVCSDRVQSGDMVGKVVPGSVTRGEQFRRTISRYSPERPSVRIDGSEWAYVWHGRPMDVTSYA